MAVAIDPASPQLLVAPPAGSLGVRTTGDYCPAEFSVLTLTVNSGPAAGGWSLQRRLTLSIVRSRIV